MHRLRTTNTIREREPSDPTIHRHDPSSTLAILSHHTQNPATTTPHCIQERYSYFLSTSQVIRGIWRRTSLRIAQLLGYRACRKHDETTT